MNEWSSTRLEAATSVLRRGTAPVYVESSDVMAIGQRCVRNEGFDSGATRPHDARVAAQIAPEPGDVLVNSTGTGTIGRSCVFPEAAGQYMVDGHVTLVRPKPDVADGVVINELLRSGDGQRYLESHCYTGSTNQIELSRTELARMPICLPPLREQRRIAEVLDAIDETIRATERIVEKLWLARQGTLDALLEEADRVHEHRPLLDLVTLPSGQVDPRAEPYRSMILVAPDHILGGGRGHLIERSTAAVQGAISGKYEFAEGDVVYSKIRPELRKAWLATFDGICSADMYPMRPGPDIMGGYLSQVLLGQRFSRFSVAVSGRSSGMPKINRQELAEFEIALPPVQTQAAIDVVAQGFDQRITAESDVLRKLRMNRSGLAADLLSGRVRTVAAP